ncbi:L-2,4-diaminobutyrate decarboxylase [Aspergillus nidulans var. acristatus]
MHPTLNPSLDSVARETSPRFEQLECMLNHLLHIDPTAWWDQISRKLDRGGSDAVRQWAIPGEPHDVSTAIREACMVFDHCMHFDHPRFFSYMPCCPSPLARVGDALSSIFNVNAGLWRTSSGPTVIENSLLSWLACQVGFPPSAGGCFVSGGSMANLTAIVAARDALVPRDRQSDGIVYLSDQTHVSVAKSLRIVGFHDAQIRILPSNPRFQMDVERLRQTIVTDRQKGGLPFLIIGSCGTTNTGSIDPIPALADLAREEHLWLHVDGAYGASIALSARHRHLVDGIGRADSLSWDAHKWLFQTYGCGIVLTRAASTLQDSFAVDADYLRTNPSAESNMDFCNVSPELSRPSRAMSLWFTFRVLGRRQISDMIDHGFHLAKAAEHELRQLARWEIISPATGAIVVFRYAPAGWAEQDLERLNLAISTRLLEENIAAILTTKLRGLRVLRLCTMNPTVPVDAILQILRRMQQVAETTLVSVAQECGRKGI